MAFETPIPPAPPPRQPTVWLETEPGLWSWGDWFIMRETDDMFRLIVSSGVEYHPFASLAEAKQHAEDVRGD